MITQETDPVPIKDYQTSIGNKNISTADAEGNAREGGEKEDDIPRAQSELPLGAEDPNTHWGRGTFR